MSFNAPCGASGNSASVINSPKPWEERRGREGKRKGEGKKEERRRGEERRGVRPTQMFECRRERERGRAVEEGEEEKHSHTHARTPRLA